MDEDEVRRARQELAALLKRIADTKPGKMTAGIERQYGQAYQKLVRLGAAPQVRLKYRG